MTIEFSCRHCKKVLKTSDDKAGRKASCPQCGELIEVPIPNGVDSEGIVDVVNDFGIETPIREEQSFLTEESTSCQMCGALNPYGSLACSACGEILRNSDIESDGIRSKGVRVRDVFSRSWELYKENLGMCLVVPLIASLLSTLAVGLIIGVTILLYIALLVVFQNNPLAHMGVIAALVLLATPLVIIAVSYFELGKQIVLLKISLGEKPGVSEIFSGRPFLGRMILCSLLFEIIVGFGNAIFVLAGFFLTLLFWPYPYLLIDQNLPGVDAFSKSTKITSGNLISVALIFLILFCLIIMLPAVCVGMGFILVVYAAVPVVPIIGVGVFLGIIFSIFVYSFQLLVKAVTYIEMTQFSKNFVKSPS